MDPLVTDFWWKIWGGLGVVALAGILAAIIYERRFFAARGKAASWAWVRGATLPITALAAAAVALPARAIGGPEALAAFYLLLVTVAPLLYFGLHWLAGVLVRPRLTRAEAMQIALTGVFMALAPVFLAGMLQSPVYTLAQRLAKSELDALPAMPSPLVVAEGRRFAIEGIGEVWTERWQVPEGVAIERIEQRVREEYVPADNPGSQSICRSGRDVHLLWHAAIAAPQLRLYWKGADGQPAKSDWTPVPPTGPAAPFALQWLPDGFVLPLRLPKDILSLGYVLPDGRENSDSVRSDVGANNTDNCMPLTFRRAITERYLPISNLRMRFWRADTQQNLFAIMPRPAAAPAAPAFAAPAPATNKAQ